MRTRYRRDKHTSLVAILAMAASLVTTEPCFAQITATRNGTSLGDPFGNTGTGTLDSVMAAAASYYNDLFDGQLNYNIGYGWGVPSITGTPPIGLNIPGLGVRFDTGTKWYLDGTPLRNEEFQYNAPTVFDFGKGLMTSSRTMGSTGSPDLADSYDLFSVALHEIGHVLGFSFLTGLISDGVDVPYVIKTGPYAGATLLTDNVFNEGSHLSNTDPNLVGSVMTARPDLGSRYLPALADLAILADQNGGFRSNWDLESVYGVGDVTLSNGGNMPVGDGPLNAGIVTATGSQSGIAITEEPSTFFMGAVNINGGASFDIVKSNVPILTSLTMSAGAKLQMQNAWSQWKSAQIDDSLVVLRDSTITTGPAPTFGPRPELNFSNSTVIFYGSSSLGSRDTDLHFTGSKIRGNVNMTGHHVVIDGVESIVDPGFSPATITFTGQTSIMDGKILLDDLASGFDKIVVSGSLVIGKNVSIDILTEHDNMFDLALETFFPGVTPIFEGGFADWNGLSIFTKDQNVEGSVFGVTFQGVRKTITATLAEGSIAPVPLPDAMTMLLAAIICLVAVKLGGSAIKSPGQKKHWKAIPESW